MLANSIKTQTTDFTEALKWRTFVRVSLLLLVLIGSLFILDMELSEKQFQAHRQNIQAQYAFQLERLVESSADKMIQLSGAASLNDGLVKAIKSRKNFLLEEELEALDWHLQADAGLNIVGLFDAAGQAFNHLVSTSHKENLTKVIQNESPVWQVDCSETCQILSYTPLLVDGALLSVLVLSEPLSHVLLRFHHVANIDTGLLTQLESFQNGQNGQNLLANWQRYLEAVTSPEQSRLILNEASIQFSLAELQQRPRVIDLNDHVYELKALPFKNSQLVVMTEVSSDYGLQVQSKNKSIQVAGFILILGEILLFVFLWTPLSRLKFSENLVSLLAERRFEELKTELEQAGPEQTSLARNALRLGDDFIAMQRQITDQTLRLDSIDEEINDRRSELTMLLDEFSTPLIVLDSQCQITTINHYLKAQLCLPLVSLIGRDIAGFLKSDIALKACLDDVLDGRLAEYQLVLSCDDYMHQSHTYLWRFSLLKSSEVSEDASVRRLLMMGMPLSEPSLDDTRDWLAHHDIETTFLNAKGFMASLATTIKLETKLTHQEPSQLILFRLPAKLLDKSIVSRLYFLKSINQFYAEFSQYQSGSASNSLFSRIDDNEFAFVYSGGSSSDSLLNLVEDLRLFLNKVFGDFLERNTCQALEIASYIPNKGDLYPLDVLANARKQYDLKLNN
ncbi:MAG: hypothetical protein ACI8O8_000769 [Oleiphilaceae bacterium]|jgi:hypothetical protein